MGGQMSMGGMGGQGGMPNGGFGRQQRGFQMGPQPNQGIQQMGRNPLPGGLQGLLASFMGGQGGMRQPSPQQGIQQVGRNPLQGGLGSFGGGSPIPAGLQDPSLAGTGGYSPAPARLAPQGGRPQGTGGMDPRTGGGQPSPMGQQPMNSGLHPYRPQDPTQQQPMNSGLHPYQSQVSGGGYGSPTQPRAGMTGIQNPGAATGNPIARQGGGGGMMPQAVDLTGGGIPAPQSPMQAQAPQNIQQWDGLSAMDNLSGSGALEFAYDPATFGKNPAFGGMGFSSASLGADRGLGANMWLSDLNGNPIAGNPNGQGFAQGMGGVQAEKLQQGQKYRLNYAGRDGASPFRISGNFR
jgi:hypothetical protein